MQTISIGDPVRIHLIGVMGEVTNIVRDKLYTVYANGKYHECLRDWIEKIPEYTCAQCDNGINKQHWYCEAIGHVVSTDHPACDEIILIDE